MRRWPTAASRKFIWLAIYCTCGQRAWIGALAVLLMLIGPVGKLSGARGAALYQALAASAPGSILVATLLLTGVVNGLVLIGPAHMVDLPASRYGRFCYQAGVVCSDARIGGA